MVGEEGGGWEGRGGEGRRRKEKGEGRGGQNLQRNRAPS